MCVSTTTRKLNRVRNSFYVYLPRAWCDKHSLKKDSEVRLEESPEGVLVIIPPAYEGQIQRELTVKIKDADKNQVEILLTGAYIIGGTTIALQFPQAIDMATREKISRWIRRLPGFEILDEHSDTLVVSDTSEKQMILPILKRQFSTAKYMLNGLVTAMESGNTDLAARILPRDEDVDRHRYFVERLCHLALQDAAYARKIAITPSDCLNYSLAAKYVERIADHVCDAASEFIALKEVSASVIKTSKVLTSTYEQTMKTFFSTDSSKQEMSVYDEKAFEVLESAEELAQRLEKMGSSRRGVSPRMVLLLMHLERVASYCADIGEVAINRLIGSKIGLSLSTNRSDT
ncbi:MAG: PhoU domain-containing protein [Candidatus Thorarchaeota archaeon]